MPKLRPLTDKYIQEINDFWERDWSHAYSIPDQKASVIDSVVVDDNDKAIAYGQVRLFPELMLFEDLSISKRDRVIALKLLMTEAFRGIDRLELPTAYCLIKDLRFARLIAKKYGFNIVHDPGVLLTRKMR